MANQYTKLSAENIAVKVNRKRNPVTSVAQLAEEFGVNATFTRGADWYGRHGQMVKAAPRGFRAKVQRLVGGTAEYQRVLAKIAVNRAAK